MAVHDHSLADTVRTQNGCKNGFSNTSHVFGVNEVQVCQSKQLYITLLFPLPYSAAIEKRMRERVKEREKEKEEEVYF